MSDSFTLPVNDVNGKKVSGWMKSFGVSKKHLHVHAVSVAAIPGMYMLLSALFFLFMLVGLGMHFFLLLRSFPPWHSSDVTSCITVAVKMDQSVNVF